MQAKFTTTNASNLAALIEENTRVLREVLEVLRPSKVLPTHEELQAKLQAMGYDISVKAWPSGS